MEDIATEIHADAATEERRHLLRRAGRHRVLVVIDEPCPSQSLCATLRGRAARESIEALVIAPGRGSTATQWYVDEDAARADAAKRLRGCISCLAAGGIRVRGRLADPDPVSAIADALHDFPADEILLITARQRPSTWLRPNLIDRVRRGFDQPVEHVVVSPDHANRKGAMNVLVAAASRNGATAEIADAIGRTLRGRGLSVTVAAPERVDDTGAYDAFVLGSAVYTGHWLQPARALVERVGPLLADRPVWLFSSGPVGDPSRKLVQQMGADPVDLPALRERTNAREHRMFAGRLVGEHASLAQRVSLQVFRDFEGDFRNWSAIEQWAGQIADALLGPEPSVGTAAHATSVVGSG
jgi:menaquinone-dependent protoporphyrinogen oxidase